MFRFTKRVVPCDTKIPGFLLPPGGLAGVLWGAPMKIGIAQINPVVGDFPGNAKRILAAYRECLDAGRGNRAHAGIVAGRLSAAGFGVQIAVRAEMPAGARLPGRRIPRGAAARRLCGPPPSDTAGQAVPQCRRPGWSAGEIRHRVWKTLLPTYDVFDERRYFEPGESCEPIVWNGLRIGVTICEDIWTEDYLQRPFYDRDPVDELAAQGHRSAVQPERLAVSSGQARAAARDDRRHRPRG